MYAIETFNLTKQYKNKVAVNKLNLKVEVNEIYTLLGVNGAGKTTTIKMLSTLIKPTSGSASVLGFDLNNDLQKIKNLINVSPQETAIALNLTVLENLEFMAGVYKIKNKKIKINSLVEMFNLHDVLNQKTKTLSGGWQRKLSIALSLINEPKIIFLDEPTLGLDVLSRKELWTIINELKKTTTIILTTHYMEEAEKLSDHIGIIKDGEIIKYGTVHQILESTNKTNVEDAFTYIVSGGLI